MSLATPLCSGTAVSASRRLGGARVWCCGDGERALGAHAFSSRVALFLPQALAEPADRAQPSLLLPPLLLLLQRSRRRRNLVFEKLGLFVAPTWRVMCFDHCVCCLVACEDSLLC